MEKRRRRTHTAEFKAQAVILASEMKSVNKAAAQLGLAPNLLRLWMKKYSGGGVTRSAIVSQQQLEDEVRKLQKELAEQKKIKQILKTAAAIYSQDHLK
jgi:transposase